MCKKHQIIHHAGFTAYVNLQKRQAEICKNGKHLGYVTIGTIKSITSILDRFVG